MPLKLNPSRLSITSSLVIKVFFLTVIVLNVFLIIQFITFRKSNRTLESGVAVTSTVTPIKFDLSSYPQEKIWEMLRNDTYNDCRFKKFDILYKKKLTDTYEGSCTQTHTWFNPTQQTIRMKCAHESHVPFLYHTLERFQEPRDERLWKIFPGLNNKNGEFSVEGMNLIHTACVNLETRTSYHNFFVQLIRDEALVRERREAYEKSKRNSGSGESTNDNEESEPLNIHVIIIDSVARKYFHRHFPHTEQFLNQLDESSEHSVVEFEQYHIVGHNTAANMYQFSTAKDISMKFTVEQPFFDETEKRLAGGPIEIPLLWDHLKTMGYISSIGEEAGNWSSPIKRMIGFRHNAVTFDVDPVYPQVYSYIAETVGRWFLYRPFTCPCAGNKFMSTIAFEYAQSFFEKYDDLPKFLMTAHNEGHDPRANHVLILDPELKKYLEWMRDSGQLKRTAVLLMGDHGLNFGPIFKASEKQGDWEHQRPYASLILPKRYATDRLKENAKRLINIRDFHMTIRDLATFPHRSTEGIVSPIAQSLLFDEIDKDRSCEDMKVGYKYRMACGEKGQQIAKKLKDKEY